MRTVDKMAFEQVVEWAMLAESLKVYWKECEQGIVQAEKLADRTDDKWVFARAAEKASVRVNEAVAVSAACWAWKQVCDWVH